MRIFYALFFLSGLTGICYEIIWFKQFSYALGSSPSAMAAVTSAFLGGLGIGARLGDAFGSRFRNCGFWYGCCEICIGIIAFFIPEAIACFSPILHAYVRCWQSSPIATVALRLAFAFLVIGLPCLLMGATLPLLVRRSTTFEHAGRLTCLLYSLNSFGAAVGCYVAGFHFIPAYGLSEATNLAASVNIMIGIVAILSSRNELAAPLLNDRPFTRQTKPFSLLRNFLSPITILAFASGFASLAMQAIWFRQMALILGSSAYAFTATLFNVLCGISIGSALSHAFMVDIPTSRRRLFDITLACSAAIVLSASVLPIVTDCVALLMPLRVTSVNNAIVNVLAAAVVELPASVGMGAVFPLLVHLHSNRDERPRYILGDIYLLNIAGAICGSALSVSWLIPNLGCQNAQAAVCLLYLVCLPLCICGTAVTSSQGSATALVIGLVVYMVCVSHDPRQLNAGMFMYGYLRPDEVQAGKVLFFKESVTSNVMVTQNRDVVSLRVNGKVDGSSGEDMAMQLALAYVPTLILPNASNVFIVGYGTGVTAGGCLLACDAFVTCCEIEPAVVDAAHYFSNVNHAPRQDPRMTIVFDDARALIQETNTTFDLILSEPSNPWVSGVSSLFSTEFYEIAKSKLTEPGILAQWIQGYKIRPEEFAMICNTIASSFSHYHLFSIGTDTIVLASRQDLSNRLRNAMFSRSAIDHKAAIRNDLSRYFGVRSGADLLIKCHMLDEYGIDKLISTFAHGSLNSDRESRLEYDLYFSNLGVDRGVSVKKAILHAIAAESVEEQLAGSVLASVTSEVICDKAKWLCENGRDDISRLVMREALKSYPNSADVVVTAILQDDHLNSELVDRLFSMAEPVVAQRATYVGVSLWKRSRFKEAVTIFERLCVRFPQSASCWGNLAINQRQCGLIDASRKSFNKARSLDLNNPILLESNKYSNE